MKKPNIGPYYFVGTIAIIWLTYLTFSPFLSFRPDWTLALAIGQWLQLVVIVTGLATITSQLNSRT